jgi:hypothetical protein
VNVSFGGDRVVEWDGLDCKGCGGGAMLDARREAYFGRAGGLACAKYKCIFDRRSGAVFAAVCMLRTWRRKSRKGSPWQSDACYKFSNS